MGKCIIMTGTVGRIDPDDLSATIGDVLKGKVAGVQGNDEPMMGTLELTGSAADSQVLYGQSYYNTDVKNKRTGTMANRGAVLQTLNAGDFYTIPAGYHNGSGKVTANSLPGQTSATAAAGHILSGQTAWVNGNKITGNMANQGTKTASLNCGGSYTIPAGYHNGSGKVTANSLASQTGGATADDSKVLSGYTYWKDGTKRTGNMPVQGGSTTVPGTSNKTIVAANRYVNGNIIVSGDSKLVAGNIKKGVTIFGVTGTHSGYVVEPTDLYSRGNNVNGWHITAGDSSKFQFGSAQITMNNPAVHIDATRGFSTIGFRYLCFEMNISKGGRIELYYIDGATVLGNLDTSSTGAVTLKIDISAAQYPNLAALRIYNFVGALFRIYLSN